MHKRRVVLFAAICAGALCLVVGYALAARPVRGAGTAVGDAVPEIDDPARLAAVTARPHLVFINQQPGKGFGRVAVAPLDALGGPRYLTPLSCERVFVAGGTGLCLHAGAALVRASSAIVFDRNFAAGATVPLQGYPSRVRVSPDGRIGAFTVFVAGDSYAADGFSTRTMLIDTASGTQIGELETFRALRDGRPFREADFNYWGVTFTGSGDSFYATLATGGRTFLVEGSVSAREVRVLREGVECPSISPDGRRIAFKSRRPDPGRATWELHTLDLSTGEEAVAEVRNTDDQATWLSADHALYALRATDSNAAAMGVADIWVADATGGTPPRLFLKYAHSPTIVP